MIKKALEEETDARLYQRWIPFSTEITFDEFKNELIQKAYHKHDYRSADDILLNIKAQMESVN